MVLLAWCHGCTLAAVRLLLLLQHCVFGLLHATRPFTSGHLACAHCLRSNGITAMGVADGVYMWKEKGIDAGSFRWGCVCAVLRVNSASASHCAAAVSLG